ncbi:MAG: BON domain-containing protein [Candidatus Methylomirabilales bacterium]
MPKRVDAIGLMRIVLVGVVLAAASCAPHFDETMREYYDDVAITTRVKAAIAGEGFLSYLSISVETFKGVVLLSGFVDSEYQRQRAVQVAKNVPGVSEVKALLVVKYLEVGPGAPAPTPKP